MTLSFDSAYDNRFKERPQDLMLTPKAPQDMNFAELGRFISAMERSGADVEQLKVERMLKIVIPITSVIILLFAASARHEHPARRRCVRSRTRPRHDGDLHLPRAAHEGLGATG